MRHFCLRAVALFGPSLAVFLPLQVVHLNAAPVPPLITSEPQSQSAFVGDSVTLSVTAVGSAPLGYQWFLNNAALSGATSNPLVFASVQFSNAGIYSVVISNTVGTTNSSYAALKVSPRPCLPPPSGLVSWWKGEG